MSQGLKARLAAEIAQTGPLTIAQYMTACLHDPQDGYYATRPALGETGDFITAPLVSQMFGELIGIWAASAWRLMGEPEVFRLVEMGPGDGTLIEDLLRAGRALPGFLEAADVWLVETSAPLIARQRERLGDAVRWASALDGVPDGAPILLVANELLDCLPARQFVRTATGWAEQVVGLGDDGGLAFGLVPAPMPCPTPATARSWRSRRPRRRSAPPWANAWPARAARRCSSTTAAPSQASATPCRRSAATRRSIPWLAPARRTSPSTPTSPP